MIHDMYDIFLQMHVKEQPAQMVSFWVPKNKYLIVWEPRFKPKKN